MTGNLSRDPFVLIIDDEDQESFVDLIRNQGVRAAALYPDDVDADTLQNATIVVLDQYLERWPGRDSGGLPVTLRVADGLALSAVLRSQVEGSGKDVGFKAKPVAFALRTGELDRIGAGLPHSAREHLLAGQYNLEWVFDKKAPVVPMYPSTAARVAGLAKAVADLPDSWAGDSLVIMAAWLKLPEGEWRNDALWQIEQCRPPRHAVAERTAGTAWLKWFLHRILPYPTFLLSDAQVALTLGMRVEGFSNIVDAETLLAQELANFEYKGHLAQFMGRRWWRAGINDFIDRLVGDDIDDLEVLQRELKNLDGDSSSIEFLSLEHPVLCTSADYGTLPEPISMNEAVRLQPDAWPPYADEAWAAKAAIDDPDGDEDLRAMVVFADRWKVHSIPSN